MTTTYAPDLFAPHLGVPIVRPICTEGRRGSDDLTLWNPFDSPDAWIAMQDAPHLRDYR